MTQRTAKPSKPRKPSKRASKTPKKTSGRKRKISARKSDAPTVTVEPVFTAVPESEKERVKAMFRKALGEIDELETETDKFSKETTDIEPFKPAGRDKLSKYQIMERLEAVVLAKQAVHLRARREMTEANEMLQRFVNQNELSEAEVAEFEEYLHKTIGMGLTDVDTIMRNPDLLTEVIFGMKPYRYMPFLDGEQFRRAVGTVTYKE